MDSRAQQKQYLDIAWRRKWWVIVPTLLGAAVSIGLAMTLPRVYRASTTILVSRQSVPDDLVRTTVTMRIDERMKSLRIQVMSRRYLENIAKEFGYAAASASEAEVQRACGEIRASVELAYDKKDFTWFTISVRDQDPKRAADVANRLAELFIAQNTQMRAAQAKGAVETVDRWKQEKENELRTRDQQIARFREQYMYELPDQQGAVLSLLNSAQARVQQLTSDIQMRGERLALFRAEEKTRQANAEALGVISNSNDPNLVALTQMSRELQELRTSYTDKNPMVKRKQEQIAEFKALHPELEAKKDAATGDVTSPELARLEADVRGLESDRRREQSNIDELRRRLGSMPKRQQQLADLTRGYDALKVQFDSVSGQKDRADRAEDVEAARQGEQFQVQDPARPPAVPFSPNFILLLLIGAFSGLAAGAALAVGLELLDQSIRSEEQFALCFPEIQMLGSIPSLDAETAAKKGGMRKRAKRTAAAGVAVVLASLTTVLTVRGGV